MTIPPRGIRRVFRLAPRRLGRRALTCALGLALGPLSAPGALAQESRAEAEKQKREEKAARLEPFTITMGERIGERVQNVLNAAPQGVYPWFGSILGGGWLAGGVGYRRTIGDTGVFNGVAAISLKNYKLLLADVTLPQLSNRRLQVDLRVRWMDAPRVAFYGIGNTSSRDEASYTYRPTSLGATATFRPVRWFAVGGGADYLDVETRGGKAAPSIDEVYDPEDVPGLGASPSYAVGRAFAAVDWRTSPGYSRSGGLYRVDYSNYAQRDGDRYSFQRIDVELDQLVPILRANWVIGLRALASFTDVGDGNQVPYFALPYLGSSRTLRGYASRRFTDRHRMMFSAEYRWTPSHFLDMVVFADTGKVAPTIEDLDLKGLKSDVGIGARFHSPTSMVLRLELARGSEGWKFIWSQSAVF